MLDLGLVLQNKFCTLHGAFHILPLTPSCSPRVSWLECPCICSSSGSPVFLIQTLYLLPAHFIPSAHPVSSCGVVVVTVCMCVCVWWVIFWGFVFKALWLFPSKAAPQPAEPSHWQEREKHALSSSLIPALVHCDAQLIEITCCPPGLVTLLSAVLVRTPAWEKGVQIEGAACGGLSR